MACVQYFVKLIRNVICIVLRHLRYFHPPHAQVSKTVLGFFFALIRMMFREMKELKKISRELTFVLCKLFKSYFLPFTSISMIFSNSLFIFFIYFIIIFTYLPFIHYIHNSYIYVSYIYFIK